MSSLGDVAPLVLVDGIEMAGDRRVAGLGLIQRQMTEITATVLALGEALLSIVWWAVLGAGHDAAIAIRRPAGPTQRRRPRRRGNSSKRIVEPF